MRQLLWILAVAACADKAVDGTGGSDTFRPPSTDSEPPDSPPPGETGESGTSWETGESGHTGETGETAPPPVPLAEAVRLSALENHLDELQAIADAHEGTRAATTGGYTASVDYAIGVLEGAGYRVQTESFSVFDFESLAAPELEQLSPTPQVYSAGSDIGLMNYSGGGEAIAAIRVVDPVLPPGKKADTSTSGCEASDFDDLQPGEIALIQRGTCSFAEKAANAEAAGASAVLIFNEGQEGRRGVVGGTLDGAAPATVPVLGTTFALGAELAALAATTEVQLRVVAEVSTTESVVDNIYAETETGDPKRTVVIGAHLDSVEAGPGINDNGTGSAFVLETAVQAAATGFEPDNRIRFVLWGAEELGLLGSEYHVAGLSEAELAGTLAYLNFDMIGSPNGVPGVYDGDGSEFPDTGPAGSGAIEALFNDWIDAQGVAPVPAELSGRSDYAPYADAGVPVGGLFTGAEQPKTTDQAKLYGGDAATAYDPCYHQVCDTRDNLEPELFELMARAAAATTEALARHAGPLVDP